MNEQILKDFPENVLGIIRKWGVHKTYLGLIVVRKGNALRSLDQLVSGDDNNGCWWPNLPSLYDEKDLIIEVIPKGSIVQIKV